MTPFHQRPAFLGANNPYGQSSAYGTHRGKARMSRRPISHTSIGSHTSTGSNAPQSFPFGLPQTPQPYIYPDPDHTLAQEAAGEQNQAGVRDSESGEETQDRSTAQKGSCCTHTGSCCMMALVEKAFSLAEGIDQKFELHVKCSCDNHVQFSNKDR